MLTGKVVDSVSKGPLARVKVILYRVNSPQPVFLEARTDDDGIYRFPVLSPGRYSISADRPGYTAGNTIETARQEREIRAGETTAGREIVLAPQAVIRGRVVDADGEPVEQAHVQVLGIRRGRQSFGGPGVQTDDRGEFRIAKLPAGSYRILAMRGNVGAAALDAASGRRAIYAPTYYPSATESPLAAEVRVGAGEERAGVEIRLQRVAVVRVSGTVSGELAKDDYVQIGLQPADPRADASLSSRHSSTYVAPQAGGRFVLETVRAGEYILTATSRTAVGTTRFRATHTDIEDVGVTLRPFFQVEGKVHPRSETKMDFANMHIGLTTVGGNLATGGAAVVRPDGTFTMDRLAAGRYRVNVTSPNGWVLGSIVHAGQTVPSMIVDLSAGPAPIEIVMHNQPSSITGTVEGIADSRAEWIGIAIEIDGEPFSPSLSGLRTRSSPVKDGKFQIPNLRAAKYNVFVVPAELMELVHDPAYAARLAAKAVEVTLAEGVTLPLSIRPISEKDVDQN